MNVHISNMLCFLGIIGLCILFKFKYKKTEEEHKDTNIEMENIENDNIENDNKQNENTILKKVSFDKNNDIIYPLPPSHTSFFLFYCEECNYGIPNHAILYCYLDKQFCSEFCRNKFIKYKKK